MFYKIGSGLGLHQIKTAEVHKVCCHDRCVISREEGGGLVEQERAGTREGSGKGDRGEEGKEGQKLPNIDFKPLQRKMLSQKVHIERKCTKK